MYLYHNIINTLNDRYKNDLFLLNQFNMANKEFISQQARKRFEEPPQLSETERSSLFGCKSLIGPKIT
jgi:hypothetical protein